MSQDRATHHESNWASFKRQFLQEFEDRRAAQTAALTGGQRKRSDQSSFSFSLDNALKLIDDHIAYGKLRNNELPGIGRGTLITNFYTVGSSPRTNHHYFLVSNFVTGKNTLTDLGESSGGDVSPDFTVADDGSVLIVRDDKNDFLRLQRYTVDTNDILIPAGKAQDIVSLRTEGVKHCRLTILRNQNTNVKDQVVCIFGSFSDYVVRSFWSDDLTDTSFIDRFGNTDSAHYLELFTSGNGQLAVAFEDNDGTRTTKYQIYSQTTTSNPPLVVTVPPTLIKSDDDLNVKFFYEKKSRRWQIILHERLRVVQVASLSADMRTINWSSQVSVNNTSSTSALTLATTRNNLKTRVFVIIYSSGRQLTVYEMNATPKMEKPVFTTGSESINLKSNSISVATINGIPTLTYIDRRDTLIGKYLPLPTTFTATASPSAPPQIPAMGFMHNTAMLSNAGIFSQPTNLPPFLASSPTTMDINASASRSNSGSSPAVVIIVLILVGLITAAAVAAWRLITRRQSSEPDSEEAEVESDNTYSSAALAPRLDDVDNTYSNKFLFEGKDNNTDAARQSSYDVMPGAPAEPVASSAGELLTDVNAGAAKQSSYDVMPGAPSKSVANSAGSLISASAGKLLTEVDGDVGEQLDPAHQYGEAPPPRQ